MKIIGEVKNIPEDAVIVNDLSITRFNEGGLLPEDNVRIYVPMDVNQELILIKLESLFDELGELTWRNKMDYSIAVSKLIRLLELYDQSLIEQGNYPVVQTGETIHSKLAIETAEKMCRILIRNEGTGDMFPYEEIAELSKTYGFETDY